jgi:hypothetical protein
MKKLIEWLAWIAICLAIAAVMYSLVGCKASYVNDEKKAMKKRFEYNQTHQRREGVSRP